MARVSSGAVGPREKEITADTICARATNLLLALYKEFQVTLTGLQAKILASTWKYWHWH